MWQEWLGQRRTRERTSKKEKQKADLLKIWIYQLYQKVGTDMGQKIGED